MLLECIYCFGQILSRTMNQTIKNSKQRALMTEFLKHLELLAVQFAKSILIDARLHKYKQSILAASLYSAVIEIRLAQLRSNALKPPKAQVVYNVP